MNTARLYLTFRHLELAAHIAIYSPSLPYGSPAYHAALTLWCMLDLAASTIRDVATGHLAAPADVRRRADLYTRTDPQAPHRATACNLAADVLEAPADILAALARADVPVDALVAACPDLGPALGIGEEYATFDHASPTHPHCPECPKERGEWAHSFNVSQRENDGTGWICSCPGCRNQADRENEHGDVYCAGCMDADWKGFPEGKHTHEVDSPIPLTPSDARIAMAEEPLPRGPEPVVLTPAEGRAAWDAVYGPTGPYHPDGTPRALPAVLSAPDSDCGSAS
jgi:hypothetical protein